MGGDICITNSVFDLRICPKNIPEKNGVAGIMGKTRREGNQTILPPFVFHFLSNNNTITRINFDFLQKKN